MESLLDEQTKFEKRGNLQKTIDDVQRTIDMLQSARDALATNPKPSLKALEKLQKPIKTSNDKVNTDLKEIYNALNSYGKALDKKFKSNPLPTAEDDALASHPSLVNRAIGMHLLREGQFTVANAFMKEAQAEPPAPEPTASTPNPSESESWEEEMANKTFASEKLKEQFSVMYYILRKIRDERNLVPAIAWARTQSEVLETRGSNLEFELHRLQFICLFMSIEEGDGKVHFQNGPHRAMKYARTEFLPFQKRYSRELKHLIGALPFYSNLRDSPYAETFYNDSAWGEVATSFTREFCSLLGLSADSPLYIAATAGAIALPTLLKLQNIMKEKRTEWITEQELPVEIPLPPAYHFHSIFVCPVSKEQATDQNPPMMMPCGHVICRESLERVSKGSKFKCPYCPNESHARDAKEVFL